MLTARLQQDPLLSEFATIVLDEFHERSIHADLALALAREALSARADLRLIVMSATLDATRVASYLGNCPIVEVAGRLHPIEIHHRPDMTVADAGEMLLRSTSGDLLCFEPGVAEIHKAIAELRSRAFPGVDVLPLHGSLSPEEQDRALSGDSRVRRIIVSTNLAETSVTVPGVTGVIDRGLEKVARYDAERAIDMLRTERITRAAADQRAGRAGRIAPGVVCRLWSESDRLRAFREPEIQRVDLGALVLDILAWGGDPGTVQWLDPPPPASLRAALNLLDRMGAVDGLRLTPLGRAMQRLPLAPRLARAVVDAHGDRRVVRAVAALAEGLSLPPARPSASSDLLSVLDAWHTVPDHVRRTASELEAVIRDERASAASPIDSDERLRRALLAGYPDRVAMRREPRSNRFLLATGTGAVLSEDSSVRDADFIVALDARAPDQSRGVESRIRLASAVDREWLVPTSTDVEHVVDDRGLVRARQVVRYDALVLAEHIVTPDAERAAAALASEWLRRGPDPGATRLIARAMFAGCDLDLPALVSAASYGVRALDDIDIRTVLPRDVAETIARNAPESIPLPSGRRAMLEYDADGTVSTSVKLQELFGLAETPSVGPRREPVLLSLLAPNGRPVQVTRDLKSFWDRTYPEVRKELRGRYPKHPWPDDPWHAVPTHRTKARS
jgi:ATP-dependent helicase HrpB